jgi:outer membrane protein, heavy metal efflux system
MFSIARKNPAARFSFVVLMSSLCAILYSVVLDKATFAQEPASSHAGAVAPLSELLDEAQQNNPRIEAARQGWQAAKQVPTQVATLPDSQFNVQQVNVGSPRPFAGYTNSDFAYFGLGISQDFPYPGKLRQKGELAKRDADVAQQQYESRCRSILAGVKSADFQLAYLSKTLGILESDGELLQQVKKAAAAWSM